MRHRTGGDGGGGDDPRRAGERGARARGVSGRVDPSAHARAARCSGAARGCADPATGPGVVCGGDCRGGAGACRREVEPRRVAVVSSSAERAPPRGSRFAPAASRGVESACGSARRRFERPARFPALRGGTAFDTPTAPDRATDSAPGASFHVQKRSVSRARLPGDGCPGPPMLPRRQSVRTERPIRHVERASTCRNARPVGRGCRAMVALDNRCCRGGKASEPRGRFGTWSELPRAETLGQSGEAAEEICPARASRGAGTASGLGERFCAWSVPDVQNRSVVTARPPASSRMPRHRSSRRWSSCPTCERSRSRPAARRQGRSTAQQSASLRGRLAVPLASRWQEFSASARTCAHPSGPSIAATASA